MSELTRISLSDLDDDAGEVAMPDGTIVKIKHMDGIGYQTLFTVQANLRDPKSVGLLYDVAARCVRDVAREQVDALTSKQVGAILALASGNIETVKKFAQEIAEKNGHSPAAHGAAGRTRAGLSPTTPSATSSSKSRARQGKHSAAS